MPITIEDVPGRPVSYRMASVDDHVGEPATLWTDRLPADRWGDRVPAVRRDPDGTRRWFVDGEPVPLPVQERWQEAVDGELASPAGRLHAMDQQGVDVSVLYPTAAGPAGQVLGRVTDPELELACVRAYNDWLVEEWAAASPRFVPLCLVPLHPVEAAVTELERAVGMGHRGLVYPALPSLVRADAPELTAQGHAKLWQACAALDVPVSFHSGAAAEIMAPVPGAASPGYAAALEAINEPVSSALFVAHLLLSQVLAPHPGLKAVFGENSLGWMGFALETMDYLVSVDRLNIDTYPVMPSEVFARQCFCVGSYEHLAEVTTDAVPLRSVLWSTSHPGPGSTWPDTPVTVANALARVAEPACRQVLWENAAQLYRLAEVVAVAAPAGGV